MVAQNFLFRRENLHTRNVKKNAKLFRALRFILINLYPIQFYQSDAPRRFLNFQKAKVFHCFIYILRPSNKISIDSPFRSPHYSRIVTQSDEGLLPSFLVSFTAPISKDPFKIASCLRLRRCIFAINQSVETRRRPNKSRGDRRVFKLINHTIKTVNR